MGDAGGGSHSCLYFNHLLTNLSYILQLQERSRLAVLAKHLVKPARSDEGVAESRPTRITACSMKNACGPTCARLFAAVCQLDLPVIYNWYKRKTRWHSVSARNIGMVAEK